MMRYWTFLLPTLIGLSFSGLSTYSDSYLSPEQMTMDARNDRLYIAGHTARQITVFDTQNDTVVKSFPLPEQPNGVVLSKDANYLYVCEGSSQGAVQIIDTQNGKTLYTLSAGHTPTAPVLSAEGKTLFVCNRFNNNVSVFDLAARKEIKRIPVLREPVAAVLTPDGRHLFVANLLHEGPANVGIVSAKVSVIDTQTLQRIRDIPLPDGSIDLNDLCISPDGKSLFVTHILARYTLPTSQLERGWINTNALSLLDTKSLSYECTVLLDSVDLGAANPWGITCTEDGKNLCVTHAGSHEVSIIDLPALFQKIERARQGMQISDHTYQLDDMKNDFSVLTGIRKRIPVSGKGPRDIVSIGKQVYFSEYFSDSVGKVNIDPNSPPTSLSYPLAPQLPLTEVRKGELFFHDATLCFQKWQSCASCHPGGARSDGLNWDLLNDGIGNPKNAKSLLLALQTPPSMISGVRPNAETAIRAGIRFIQFSVRPEQDAQAIEAYLQSLQPLASPYLIDGNLSSAARRGRRIFQAAQCHICHPAPLYTNKQSYNVGTGVGLESGLDFDTPTLVEVWRTAPYLHDGRAATIREIFTTYNPDNRHGITSGLSEQELDDLVEFVLSL